MDGSRARLVAAIEEDALAVQSHLQNELLLESSRPHFRAWTLEDVPDRVL